MNEFLDQKDSGTAILSHFYLLTGCANSVWFEGSSRLLHYTGILALGVGDALVRRSFYLIGSYAPSHVNAGIHRWKASGPASMVEQHPEDNRG